MAFNVFSVIALSPIATAIAWKDSSSPVAWFAIGWIVALTVWVNWQAKTDPRAMMYGPAEYLEESRLDHERKMAVIPGAKLR